MVIALIAIALQGGLLFLALFEPYLDYKIAHTPASALESEDFLNKLEVLADSHVHRHNKIEVLTDGHVFYEAELEAIRQAQHSVNLEAYIFQEGEITKRFVEALTERARNGVQVNIVLDAFGSLNTSHNFFKELIEAGGRVEFYHPLKWYTWPRINNRTHREIIVIDGKVGFVGGAGFADQWWKSTEDEPQWRDTMVRVEGDAVAGLQAAFVENWLEASGEILTDKGYFEFERSEGGIPALVVNSSPSAGRSTRARMVFQTLIASARKSVHITTPYFLPDESFREELARAVQERGVEVRIIVPGGSADHLTVRRTSRRLYGDVLQAGAEIYEYQPSMNHVKSLVVDGLWAVVGTTNIDPRSFKLNDEVNLVGRDGALAERLEEDFQRDLARSQKITYEEWKSRPVWEKVHERVGGLIERQQ